MTDHIVRHATEKFLSAGNRSFDHVAEGDIEAVVGRWTLAAFESGGSVSLSGMLADLEAEAAKLRPRGRSARGAEAARLDAAIRLLRSLRKA